MDKIELEKLRKPPQKDELEVTLFGKGVGESILIHFGDSRYAIIDSFRNPGSKKPIALEYLELINVPINNIELVVATHWHKDHIEGLYDILKQLKNNTKFVTYNIIQEELFNTFINSGISSDLLTNKFSTSLEFSNILNMIDQKKVDIVFASNNKVIHKVLASSMSHKKDVTFYSLSPQDKEIYDYIKSLNLPKEEDSFTILTDDNLISIVIWLEIGKNIILFGGDLLEKSNEDSGWNAILKNHILSGKADLFKVPHHGSISSHNEKVWTNLLEDKPVSILTKFNISSLPKKQDIKRLMKKSKKVYVAGDNNKIKDIGPKIQKDFGINLSMQKLGIVRLRKNLRNSNSTWNIENFGGTKIYAENDSN